MSDKDNKNINDVKYKSYFRDYIGDSNNVSIDNGNGSVPYGRFVVEQKVFKFCWQCGCNLEEGSTTPFCCWDHYQGYYKEIAKEIDAVWGEISGRN